MASVLDLGSRRLLGYSMGANMRTVLVLDALRMAIAARGGDAQVSGVIAHADRAPLSRSGQAEPEDPGALPVTVPYSS